MWGSRAGVKTAASFLLCCWQAAAALVLMCSPADVPTNLPNCVLRWRGGGHVQDVVPITCIGTGRYLSIQRLTFPFEGEGDRVLALPEVQVLVVAWDRLLLRKEHCPDTTVE